MTAPLALLQAANIPVPHGFTTRTGGVSRGAYSSLNLGLTTGDDPGHVAENRRRVLGALGTSVAASCALEQVHGADVLEAEACWFTRQGDALISAEPGRTLIISTADCLPILFYDPQSGAVGAAHCGWRGTLARLASKTLAAMTARYGSRAQEVQVAFGPAISKKHYQVGQEVVEAFIQGGFSACYAPDSFGKYLLDVPAANAEALFEAGVGPENLTYSPHCTFAEAALFFSHRRDQGITGRQWALIRAQ